MRQESWRVSTLATGRALPLTRTGGAEAVEDAEGNMGGAAMRGSDALPGSKATSRSKGTRRNLGDLLPGRVASSRTGPYREGEEP